MGRLPGLIGNNLGRHNEIKVVDVNNPKGPHDGKSARGSVVPNFAGIRSTMAFSVFTGLTSVW